MSETETTGKLRVAAYIRIGGSGETRLQCEVLTRYYWDLISRNPDWRYAGIYADLGAEMRDCPELKRLIADCEAGNINLIITKSVSRISRNLDDVMTTVHKLLDLERPVGIYFENEGISTLTNNNLNMLSMVWKLAVEESKHKHDRLPYIQLWEHVKRDMLG